MSKCRSSVLLLALPALLVCSGNKTKSGAADAGATIGLAVEGVCEIAGLTDGPDGGLVNSGASSVPLTSAGKVDYLRHIGCTKDFEALASEPVDATLPGARSGKVVYDTDQNDGGVYFQNSVVYMIHYDFASTHLSGNGMRIVPQLSDFNRTEYYEPSRRFILGAVTHYEDVGVWALELSPYDTASAEMISTLFHAVKNAAFYGPALAFHPTSEAVKNIAKKLPGDIPIITTDQLYAQIAYQPLNPARAVGRLFFTTADALDQGQYVSYQSIVVLDEVPNDISVVSGIITQEFQTPLSHLNVLSRNRKTPNMALRNALTDPTLLAYKDQLVELIVTSLNWFIRPATQEEAEAYWASQRPSPVVLAAADFGPRELLDVEDVTVEKSTETLRESLKIANNAWGGKTAQYSILAKTDGVSVKKAFGIPCYYYYVFMRDNGLYDKVDAFLQDPTFVSDMEYRSAKLAELRADMLKGQLDPDLETKLKAKLAADYPGKRMRFRTSTNSEDQDGFPCAGCYESHTGDPAKWETIRDAIRLAYASTWLYRTYEERSYYSVDHKSVVMALLVHEFFADEEANGVAITNNIYDKNGVDPAFYINVQYGGDAEVVHPPKGVTSDMILYYYYSPNQPTSYLARSNLIPVGTTVLTKYQLFTLGTALSAIHERFSAAYGPAYGNNGWYAMDVEFKFDNDEAPDALAKLYVKQARPYPEP
jgi:hypothetical protein